MKMQIGDVIFFRGTVRGSTSPISWLIQTLTKSEFTHVGLYVGDGKIIEADRFIKTRIRKFRPDREHHTIYRLPKLTDIQKEAIQWYAKRYEGMGYDYLQIIGFIFRLLFKWNAPLFNQANKLVCSELIDRVFYQVGVPRKTENCPPVGNVTPAELLEVYPLEIASEVYTQPLLIPDNPCYK